MMRKWMVAGAGFLLMTLLASAGVPAAWAAPQAPAGPQEKPAYTMAEYNAYQAAANEKNPAQRVKLLEDFVAKYPSSTLLIYAYRTLWWTYYNDLRNFPKTIENIDRFLTFGDKVDLTSRLQALYYRALGFHASFSDKAPDARTQAAAARDAAQKGIQMLGQWTKPEGATDEQYAESKKQFAALFNYTVGFAAMQGKDYKGAVDGFKAALAIDATAGLTWFRLGVTYLQMDPPQYMDGFWALARSIALKAPGEAQVRTYLHGQLLRYQQTGCDRLLDQQMNELLTLAAGTGDRPANYTIPSKDDLDKARQDMATFIADLKAGGDKGKLRWLATCGLEFPEVSGKVIEVVTNDSVTLRVFTGATPEETEAGAVANMEVKVEGQPEAKRIEKDSGVRFSGLLANYTPDPFLLRWEKAKVNPEDIPGEKAAPGKKAPPKRPPKKPGR